MTDGLAWADASAGDEGLLDEIFCLTFVRDLDEAEALRRMGGLPDTVAVRTVPDIGALHTFEDGYPTVASVLRLGAWTVVFEPGGFEGAGLVAGLSRGGEAVSVLRHDYASHAFCYAVAGEEVSRFDPTFPAIRYGSDPDRLLPTMRSAGFTLAPDGNFDTPVTDCLRLAELLTGTRPALGDLTGPLTSAHIEPWFSDAATGGEPVAAADVRRLAGELGVAEASGLADALTAAEAASQIAITPDSPLGLQVRDWLAGSRRASWSANDHRARDRMTDDERKRAFALGRLAYSIGDALRTATVR